MMRSPAEGRALVLLREGLFHKIGSDTPSFLGRKTRVWGIYLPAHADPSKADIQYPALRQGFFTANVNRLLNGC